MASRHRPEAAARRASSSQSCQSRFATDSCAWASRMGTSRTLQRFSICNRPQARPMQTARQNPQVSARPSHAGPRAQFIDSRKEPIEPVAHFFEGRIAFPRLMSGCGTHGRPAPDSWCCVRMRALAVLKSRTGLAQGLLQGEPRRRAEAARCWAVQAWDCGFWAGRVHAEPGALSALSGSSAWEKRMRSHP